MLGLSQRYGRVTAKQRGYLIFPGAFGAQESGMKAPAPALSQPEGRKAASHQKASSGKADERGSRHFS